MSGNKSNQTDRETGAVSEAGRGMGVYRGLLWEFRFKFHEDVVPDLDLDVCLEGEPEDARRRTFLHQEHKPGMERGEDYPWWSEEGHPAGAVCTEQPQAHSFRVTAA